MKHFENPNIVASLYLLEIELLLESFISTTVNKYQFQLETLDIYRNKSSYAHKYLELHNVSATHNVFRSKLIYSKIFSECSDMPLENIKELYGTLICIESKIISFFKDYFDSFTYIYIKDFIDKLIKERQEIVKSLHNLIA